MKGESIMKKTKGKTLVIDGIEYVECPVCGTRTQSYDICDKCGWQNSGETNIDGGPMRMTLKQAREAYKNHLPIR